MLSLTSLKNTRLLFCVLLLSGIIHLWNPIGFPDIFFDEGIYMRRAMHVLNGQGPQEADFHDHPFFGQLLLGGILFVTGFPNSLNPTTDLQSLQSLYLIPRIFMGIIAIFDTFLIYKITQKKYNRHVALIASILFAIMPFTWILRRILLDSILLPFLLSSIFIAMCTKDSGNKTKLALISGILLGLAIFTKIPVFVFIPFIAGIIYLYGNKNLKVTAIWFIPVILLPLIWPIQAISVGQFDGWIKDVLWQTQRTSGGIVTISQMFFKIDPVLFILGLSGFIFAAIKRDYFVLCWCIPFILFLSLIGYVQYFHWIPVFPIFCIAIARFIYDLPQQIKKENMKKIIRVVIVSIISIFGFTSVLMLISTDMSSAQFQTISYVLTNLDDSDTTTLAGPTYSWILKDVFDKKNVLIDYSIILFRPIDTSKILLVADPHFLIDIKRGPQLGELYNKTNTVTIFDGVVTHYDLSKYPYSNLGFNYEGSHIEIKKNFN